MIDLDHMSDELYAGAPETFVARRAELVRRARAEHDRPLAQAIGALRRPTRTAWLINLLSRRAASEVAALLDLAEALRTAQADRDGARLRDLSTQRRRDIDTLTRRAVELGREHRYAPTETTLGEVAATLQAALADPEVAVQVRRGRLATAVVYGGFGTPAAETGVDLVAALAASMPASDTTASDGQDVERRQRERRRQAALARRRDEARAAFEQAREEADRATASADASAERVERRRAELAEAERSEREARSAARSARNRARELQQAADAAEHAYREVESGEP